MVGAFRSRTPPTAASFGHLASFQYFTTRVSSGFAASGYATEALDAAPPSSGSPRLPTHPQGLPPATYGLGTPHSVARQPRLRVVGYCKYRFPTDPFGTMPRWMRR